jgi:hypothetical protein
VLPDRSATSELNDRRRALPLLRGGKDEQSNCSSEETKGEMAMISPETQTSRLLRKTANLLSSVAEAAWTSDIPSPAKWDLHRIGTEAYLAQRDILTMLGLREVIAVPQADFDIATALEEAAQVVATIPEEFQTSVTQRLQERVASLAHRAERALALRDAIQLGYDGGPLPDHEQLMGGPVVDPRRTDPGHLRLPSGAGKDAPTVPSTGVGGVVTTAGFRASCCWPQSSATSCTPQVSRHRNDGSLVNNRSATATPTAPHAA